MEEELQQQAQPLLLLRQTNPVQFAFTYLRSPDTRRQYPRNLKLFFDYLHLLPGGSSSNNNNLEEQAKAFLDKATGNPQWVEENILLFLDFHKQRVIRKEIAAGTVKNFYRPIKTFYDAHDDILPSLNWKRIAKALLQAKSSSSDRVPTIEEIAKLVENNTDRRIKPIVYTMASSGIRVGAWNYLRWKHVSPKTNEKGETQYTPLQIFALSYVYSEELKEIQKQQKLDQERSRTHHSNSSVLPYPVSVIVRELVTLLPASMTPEMSNLEEVCNQLYVLVDGGLLEEERRQRTGEFATFSITVNGMLYLKKNIDTLCSAIKDKKVNEQDIERAEGNSEVKKYLKEIWSKLVEKLQDEIIETLISSIKTYGPPLVTFLMHLVPS
jgi:hypothetical protein